MNNKELDKWIAENIMGWKYDRRGGSVATDTGEYAWVLTNWINAEGYYVLKLPNYTESISDAFQVVERMKWPLVFYFRLSFRHGNLGWTWLAEFNADSRDLYCKEEAKTAPLAICLAAKKAIENANKRL